MEKQTKKKIIIIGAGISGMTAGIYALENGYDVTIYEKHFIPGGQCTGWNRKGAYIDGCAHWIVGTNPNSDFYPIWRHIGAFDSNTIIYETEYFTKFDIDGHIITFYADLEKLKQELLKVAPEDKKQIKRFINGIKAYKFTKVPTEKPLDHMNIFEWMSYGLSMIPMAIHFAYYKHTSIKWYAKKFKSPTLRKLFNRIINRYYNIHSLVYIMRSLAAHDAGMVEGGSRNLAFNIAKTFTSKGGNIIYNSEIDHIYIEDNKAKGIILKDNTVIESDYVISACDAHHTIFNLLQGQYKDEYFIERFNNKKYYPLNAGIQVSYKLNKILYNYPKMVNFEITPYNIGGMIIDNITIRNHSFDNTLNKNVATITVLIDSKEEVYNYLVSLSKEDYLKEKENLGNHLLNEIINYVKLENNDIELIDVTTPLTYERYTNAYKGSYMSFITTRKSKGLMRKGLIKGLDNFAMAGQWIMSPGGLPIALFSGKFAVMRIAKMDKKKFIDLDYQFASHYNKNGLRNS